MTLPGAATKLPNTNGLSVLAPYTTGATALANLVMVSPQQTIGYQPQVAPPDDGSVLSDLTTTLVPPPALLFHIDGEQALSLKSDITDHYVEDNTAVQDQIALRPEKFTVHGFIGELNDVPPAALSYVKAAADKLQTVGAYAPGFSVTALLAYNEAFMLYQVGANAVNSAVSTWNALTGGGGENVIDGSSGLGTSFDSSTGAVSNNQNAQQTAFQQFYGYWRSRALFTVQTPWAVFKNMAIESLDAVQDETTNQITDFAVTFKMIRNAKVASGGLGLQGRLGSQASDLVNNGVTSGSDDGSDMGSTITGQAGG